MKKILALLVLLGVASMSHAQAISQTGGSIQGTITDPTGASVRAATVTITNPDTGYKHVMSTDKAGFYSLGPLNPGTYVVTISAPNFSTLSVTTIVQIGTVTSGNEKLVVGNSSETVEVNAGAVQVNTEQIGVAGIVTQQEIATLPINGRNILDIAQLQPNVSLQSGQSFDPTKTGYSALAINGQNGRSTRILVDGQDISDETVGTTVFNVPEGAIGEFQLNRSTQDVSGSVTSTGQVLLSTQSGTNRYHGNLFYNFQDARVGFAAVSGKYAPFQRNQYGGYAGGYIIKDKLFFFGGAERIKQSNSSPVGRTSAFFTSIYNAYPVVPDPFKDTFSMGRLDYSGPWNVHYFVRATYSNNIAFGTEGQAPYALYDNQDNVPAIVGGADFTTGRFTHSVRFGYLKFINNLGAGANALGNTVYNPSTTLGFPFELIGAIYAGSGNEDAPQNTYQSSKQFRYDGTWTKGAHSIKFGGEVTRILQGGFAAFYSTFLSDISTSTVHQFTGPTPTNAMAPGCGGVAGAQPCLGDPLNGYMPAEFVFGNGNGSGSERPSFGLPGGGAFSWRMAAYVGDTWKVKPSLTLVAGLRWSVDTDRADQDLATPTCGEIAPDLYFTGCDNSAANANTPLFDFYGPGEGLGKRTEQNYANFGPQAGFVFSPGAHRYVLRGGAGIYYENNLFNNEGNVRSQNTTAAFPAFNYGSNNYTNSTLSLPGYANGFGGVLADGTPCDGTAPTSASCITFPMIYAMPLGQATALMSKLDTKYKAAAAVPGPNQSFIGTDGGGLLASGAYAGPYKTPYSIQINGGVQYEVKKGAILSVDFIHNATLKIPLVVDTNHVGAARFLNTAAAKLAVTTTLATTCGGAASVNATFVVGGCPGGSGTDPVTGAKNKTATIADYARNGLDSGRALFGGGYSASNYGVTPNTGAAFGGANANVGAGLFELPIGKSAFDSLQVVFKEQKDHPMPGIVSSNLQIAYSLSRTISDNTGGSNEFFAGSGAFDQDCVNCYMGRDDADRSNQITMGGSVKVKYGLEVGGAGHFFSAAPSTLTLAGVTGYTSSTSAGAIFVTDVDGDGTAADLLPGTRPGAYMHEVRGAGLANTINHYNSTQAGTLTPAGQALVTAGILTQAQLVGLGGVEQPLLVAPTNPIKNDTVRAFDANVRYPISLHWVREGMTLTPGIAIYNVFNMVNDGSYSSLADTHQATATLNAGTYLNGPNNQQVLDRTRVLRATGNGTFAPGTPRSTEFSLKLDF